MKSQLVGRTVVLALATCASAAVAQQDTPAPAPVSIQTTEAQPKVYAVSLGAYPEWKRELLDGSERWRRAEPVKPVEHYFTGREPAITALLTDPAQPRIFTNLHLTISPEGRVAECVLNPDYPQQADLASALCPIVTAQLRYLPALDMARAPTTDLVRLHFSLNHRTLRPGDASTAIAKPSDIYKAAPPRMASYREAGNWPPSDRYGLRGRKPNFSVPGTVKTATGGPLDTDGRKVAGIVLFNQNDRTAKCETVIPSGDAEFDESACDHVMTTAGPSFDAVDVRSTLGYPMLVMGATVPEQIIAPDDGLAKWVALGDDARNAFLARFLPGFEAAAGDRERLRLRFSVDADGRASECRIQNSSGSTQADIFACDTVEQSLVYTPATDAFGRVRDKVGVWWQVPKS